MEAKIRYDFPKSAPQKEKRRICPQCNADILVAGAGYNIQPIGASAAKARYTKAPYLLVAFNSRAAILSDKNSIYTYILLHKRRLKIVNR